LDTQRHIDLENSAPEWLQWVLSAFRRWVKRPEEAIDIETELAALGPRAVPPLSKALLKDSDPEVRSLAARTLEELGDLESFPALTNALSLETDETVIPAIAKALAQLKDPQALPLLLSALKAQTNDSVQAEIVKCLGKFHEQLALQTLATALAHGTNDALRSAAAEALGEVEGPDSSTNLLTALWNDPAATVRMCAATALGSKAAKWGPGKADNPELVVRLSSALFHEADEEVRLRIVSILGTIGGPVAGEALWNAATNKASIRFKDFTVDQLAESIFQQPFTNVLKALRESPFESVRRSAALALVDSGEPSVIPELIRFVETNPPSLQRNAAEEMSLYGISEALPILLDRLVLSPTNTDIRQDAIASLGLLGDASVCQPLAHILTNDPQMPARAAAATALGSLRCEAALPILLDLLAREKDESLRQACIGALGNLSARGAIPPLVRCLDKNNAYAIRLAACNALGSIGDPEASAALATLLKTEKESSIRSAAIQSLGEIGGPDAVATLISTLAHCRDEEMEARTEIANACAEAGDLSVVPVLIKELDNDDQRVVAAAAEALGNLGSTTAVPKLINLATNGSKEVRAQAATALGQIGDSQALPVLLHMLKKERNPEARTKAAEALGIISNRNAVPALQDALADPEDQVRTEVVCSLGHLGNTNSAPSVIALLKGRPSNIQFAASYFLVEIGGPNGVRALIDTLDAPSPEARFPAACALAIMGQTNGLRVFRGLINHTESWYRLLSVVCLAHCKTPESNELLRLRTSDRIPAIAHLAEAALSGNITGLLVAALSDNDVSVRRSAVFAFVFHNDAAAIPALRRACSDRDIEIRTAARWTVRRLERMNPATQPK
jgi:HEAT repeat protein